MRGPCALRASRPLRSDEAAGKSRAPAVATWPVRNPLAVMPERSVEAPVCHRYHRSRGTDELAFATSIVAFSSRTSSPIPACRSRAKPSTLCTWKLPPMRMLAAPLQAHRLGCGFCRVGGHKHRRGARGGTDLQASLDHAHPQSRPFAPECKAGAQHRHPQAVGLDDERPLRVVSDVERRLTGVQPYAAAVAAAHIGADAGGRVQRQSRAVGQRQLSALAQRGGLQRTGKSRLHGIGQRKQGQCTSRIATPARARCQRRGVMLRRNAQGLQPVRPLPSVLQPQEGDAVRSGRSSCTSLSS